MITDYVTLMLINMVAGFFILGSFILHGLEAQDRNNWAPAFGVCGLVATVCGFVMTFSWPLPHPYSTAYGEMSVLLGVLFLGTAVALVKGWGLVPIALYGFFAGSAAILLGVRIIDLGLTNSPVFSGVGFILSGAAGVFSPIVVWQEDQKGLRVVGAIVLFVAAGIWAWTCCMAYWLHMLPK